jgi:endonuclease/exonuclease/phosphatase family metal-dependent hydrolase
MSFNGRKSTIPEDTGKQAWEARRDPTVEFLKRLAPDVIGAQEFTVEQCDYVIGGLGPYWHYIGGIVHGNVPIIYNSTRFQPIPGTIQELVLPSSTRDRYATLCQFQSQTTGEAVWLGSAHLASSTDSAGDDEALRVKQIRAVCTAIDKLPDNLEVILCGDFNSPTTQANYLSPVRKAAEAHGLKCLRARLSAAKIDGDSFNSTHPWNAKTPRKYRWLDDILTKSGIRLVSAALHLTSKEDFPDVEPSDHNAVTAKVVI